MTRESSSRVRLAATSNNFEDEDSCTRWICDPPSLPSGDRVHDRTIFVRRVERGESTSEQWPFGSSPFMKLCFRRVVSLLTQNLDPTRFISIYVVMEFQHVSFVGNSVVPGPALDFTFTRWGLTMLL